MVWIKDQVEDAIIDVITDIRDGILDLASDLFSALLGPIVGVPAPEAEDGYVVTGDPVNHPWQDLYGEFYVPYVLGLTLGLAFIGFAFIGLRANSLSPYERKRLLRRLLLVTIGALVWFPFVSVALQFVDALGMAIAPIDDMSADFQSMTKAAVGGVFAGLLIALVSNFMLLVAALGFALRYIGVVVLTLVMPLLGVVWALDTWPLSTTSEIARKAAAVYPGLVLAGIPAAFLFRIGFLWGIFGSDPGLWDLVLALMFIPTACVSSLLAVYWSAPAVKTVSRGGAAAGVRSPRSLRNSADRAKAATGRTLDGGRGVHRRVGTRFGSDRSSSDGTAVDVVSSPTRTPASTSGKGRSSAPRIPARQSPDRTTDPALPQSGTPDTQSSAAVIPASTYRLQRANRPTRW